MRDILVPDVKMTASAKMDRATNFRGYAHLERVSMVDTDWIVNPKPIADRRVSEETVKR